MGDIGVTMEILLHDTFLQGALVLGVLVAAGVARPLSRRLHRPYLGVVVVVLSWMLVLAVTVEPDLPLGELVLPPADAYAEQLRSCVSEWGGVGPHLTGADGVLNVLLYAPAGGGGYWLTRRPVVVVLGLVTLSAVVEVVQPLLARSCQASDWVANSGGALLGVLLAVGVLHAARAARGPVGAVHDESPAPDTGTGRRAGGTTR